MAGPRIVVVGGGFAGLSALRRLERRLSPRTRAELTLITPEDHLLYQPLLPQVASGLVTPQSIAVSLYRRLRRTRLLPGKALGIDPDGRRVVVRTIAGETAAVRYDRLILAPGSLTRSFDIPGLTEHGHGNKNLAEAVYLRDHALAQLQLANATSDPAEREERCRFIVVGGGYSGVETAATMSLLCREAARRYPELASYIDWHLIDIAPRLLPELGEELGKEAVAVLRRRGVQVKLGVSVKEVTPDTVALTDGRTLPCRTLIWTAGVAPSPLMAATGMETDHGRLVVTPELTAPQHPEIFAVGDSAAVPDLSTGGGATCPPTAQAATRQGPAAADNVIASLRGEPMAAFHYRDLGLVVDLSGRDAVARPFGYDIRGLPGLAVTRAYHLYALPSGPARARVASNWAIRYLLGGEVSRLGFAEFGLEPSFADLAARQSYLKPGEARQAALSVDGSDRPPIPPRQRREESHSRDRG